MRERKKNLLMFFHIVFIIIVVFATKTSYACQMEYRAKATIINETLEYNITLENLGNTNCTGGGVILRLYYDNHFIFNHSSPAPWISNDMWNFGTLEPSEEENILIMGELFNTSCDNEITSYFQYFSDQTGWSKRIPISTVIKCHIEEKKEYKERKHKNHIIEYYVQNNGARAIIEYFNLMPFKDIDFKYDGDKVTIMPTAINQTEYLDRIIIYLPAKVIRGERKTYYSNNGKFVLKDFGIYKIEKNAYKTENDKHKVGNGNIPNKQETPDVNEADNSIKKTEGVKKNGNEDSNKINIEIKNETKELAALIVMTFLILVAYMVFIR